MKSSTNQTRFHPQVEDVRRVASGWSLTEIPQYQVEAEECENSSSDEDVHVLRTSSFYPVDNVPAHPQRVRSVQQPLLSPFQYVPLIHQVVQDRSSLSDKIIERALRVLNETVFSQRVVFPGRGHEVWGL